MDIVLDCFDCLLLDRIYAALLPSNSALHRTHDTLNDNFAWSSVSDSYVTGNSTDFPSASRQPKLSTYLTYPLCSGHEHMSRWPRDDISRQALSLFIITWISGSLIYLMFATFSYFFVFDKSYTRHPKFIKNQIRQEIATAIKAVPTMAALTAPFFVAELRGLSFMYDTVSDSKDMHILIRIFGEWYNLVQAPMFLMFTDCGVYWIHRALHSKMLYKHLHKPHHKWIVPTPFASHAFHPIDGWAQSLPYHIFPFIFPMQKLAYIGLFTFVQLWTVMIHDGFFVLNSSIINGTACHSVHHLEFNYNFGQYFTLWDRIGGSYKHPDVKGSTLGPVSPESKQIAATGEKSAGTEEQRDSVGGKSESARLRRPHGV